MGEAFEMLRRGDAEVMLAGGAESTLAPLVVAGFDVMGALSQSVDDPARACRPFDNARDGFVMSEGAAIMVLETEAHALAWRAHLWRSDRLRQQRRRMEYGGSHEEAAGRSTP